MDILPLLEAASFGVLADGKTDDTDALVKLRDAIRRGPDRPYTVIFPPGGHVVYTDNRWATFGDRSVVLDFAGSTVECPGDTILPGGAGPISWGAEYPVVRTAANVTLPAGSLIGSAEAGASEVKLLAGDGPEFEPGDVVLLAGDIQQTSSGGTAGWGWPPNFRYFEYRTVASVPDASTLRFAEQLLFGYDAAWPDLPTTLNGQTRPYGAPRVWNCRLGKRHKSRSLTIRNANFGSTALPLNALHTRLENCATQGECWPTLARRVELIDCRLARIEFDKVVQEALLEGCEVAGGISGDGAGVLHVTLRNTRTRDRLGGIFRSITLDNFTAERGVFFSTGGAGPINRVTPITITGRAQG